MALFGHDQRPHYKQHPLFNMEIRRRHHGLGNCSQVDDTTVSKNYSREKYICRRHHQTGSLPVFSGKPEGPFCLSCTFIFRNEKNWKKESARVSEKLVSPGLSGLQVSTRLTTVSEIVPKSGVSTLQDTEHDVLRWSIDNTFELNSLKCKELRIDFRRKKQHRH